MRTRRRKAASNWRIACEVRSARKIERLLRRMQALRPHSNEAIRWKIMHNGEENEKMTDAAADAAADGKRMSVSSRRSLRRASLRYIWQNG
jgi:hypothetical protein